MRRSATVLLCSLALSVTAQNDRIFPNVSAQFDLSWPCKDPFSGPWTAYESYTFEAQPSIIIDDLEWGRMLQGNNELGKVAMDGERILYRGTDDQYVPADTTILMYDFSLDVGDTAYWDEYYGFGHAVVIDIDTLILVERERRLFTLNNDDHWLEGIGSLMGFFRPVYFTPIGCGHPTFSYCADYVDQENVPYTICSDMFMGTSQQRRTGLSVHPNPSNGTFALSGVRPGSSYRVTDARGVEVLSGRAEAASTTIAMKEAATGIYLLRIDGSVQRIMIE